jgi:hypothetical protein
MQPSNGTAVYHHPTMLFISKMNKIQVRSTDGTWRLPASHHGGPGSIPVGVRYVRQASNDCQIIPKQEIQVCRDMTPCRWVSRIVVISFSGSSSTSSMGQGQGHSIKSRPCVHQLATFKFQGRLWGRRKLCGDLLIAVRTPRPASHMHRHRLHDVSQSSSGDGPWTTRRRLDPPYREDRRVTLLARD